MKPRIVEETRLLNFRELARKEGGVKAMGSRLGKSQPQWQNTIGKTPTKQIGSEIAREVEAEYRLPKGWADMPWDMLSESQSVRLDEKKLANLIEVVEGATEGLIATSAWKAKVIATFYADPIEHDHKALQRLVRTILSSAVEQ